MIIKGTVSDLYNVCRYDEGQVSQLTPYLENGRAELMVARENGISVSWLLFFHQLEDREAANGINRAFITLPDFSRSVSAGTELVEQASRIARANRYTELTVAVRNEDSMALVEKLCFSDKLKESTNHLVFKNENGQNIACDSFALYLRHLYQC